LTGREKPSQLHGPAKIAAESRAVGARPSEPPRFNFTWLLGIGAILVGLAATVAAIASLTYPSLDEARPIAQAVAAKPDTGNWTMIRDTDAMTDQSRVLVSNVGDVGVVFRLYCDKKGARTRIDWNQFLAGEEAEDYRTKDITIRVGDGKPLEETWVVSEDGTSTYRVAHRGDEDFYLALRSADRLVARVEPYQEAPLTATFDTRGLTAILKQARPECEWFIRDILREEFASKQAGSGKAGRASERPVE